MSSNASTIKKNVSAEALQRTIDKEAKKQLTKVKKTDYVLLDSRADSNLRIKAMRHNLQVQTYNHQNLHLDHK